MPSGTRAASPADTPASQPTPAKIFVHVVGEVAKPGLVELAPGTRVAEAVTAAGGATPAAVLDAVNLARVTSDGEQIVVPNAEQVAAGIQTSPSAVQSTSEGASQGPSGSLVNLNTADAALLETLPRIGPSLAQRILDWRQANGAFATIDQLMEVSGVGAKTFEGLRERVTV
ncbi:ComEA family DNA-binding protein [Leucobacter viscericola]|uniref:ComEA family DNA-binding protein n=2 Tax=Leucobacter viscericola TaxID=2714935 RepID=A0A6G7XJD2_9MICO|nr:ComEA family DNA-binding protein [Leucobacter viscericola]